VTVEDAAAWREHTTGTFNLATYPGGHFYLNERAPQLIVAIREVLSSATAGRPVR